MTRKPLLVVALVACSLGAGGADADPARLQNIRTRSPSTLNPVRQVATVGRYGGRSFSGKR